MVWTAFLDFDSEEEDFPYLHVYIEASRDRAINVFKEKFGFLPDSIGCPRCHYNYTIDEYQNLDAAIEENRIFAPTEKELNLDEYIKNVMILRRDEIETLKPIFYQNPYHVHECLTTRCELDELQKKIGKLEATLFEIGEGIQKKLLTTDSIYQLTVNALKKDS